MALRVVTLGRLEVHLDGQELRGLPAQHLHFALLVYLAVESDVQRETLLRLFWADRPPARGRHALSQALYELRRVLGEDWLQLDAERLRVPAGAAQVDATDFQRLAASDPPAALALYQGPFLDGFVIDSAEFEQWSERQRATLARLHRKGRRELLASSRTAGDVWGALACARRWVELDPLEDEAQQALIECLAASGDRVGALHQYERYERLLRDELEVEPLDETKAFVARLRAAGESGQALAGERAPTAGATVPGAAGEQSADLPLPAATATEPIRADAAEKLTGRRRLRLPGTRTRVGLGVLGAAVIALAGSYVLLRRPPAPEAPRLKPVFTWADTIRHSVAVTRFVNASGDRTLDPIGRMAEEWVTRRLRSIPEANVVADGLSAIPDTSVAVVAALLRRTGAELLLSGSFYREGGQVLLTARLVSLRQGKGPARIAALLIGPVRAARDLPSTGLERLADVVAGGVYEGGCNRGCIPGRAVAAYDVLRLGEEGWGTEIQGDVQGAIQMWRRAIALDSTFADGYSALVKYAPSCALRDSIAQVFEGRREQFSEWDLLSIRADQALCHGDMDATYLLHKRMLEIVPDDYSTRALVAWSAASSGRLGEGERRLKALGEEGTWGGGYWETLAWTLHFQGKYGEEVRISEEGRRRPGNDLRRLEVGIAGLAALGRTRELADRIEQLRDAGLSPLGAVGYERFIAEELEWHGHASAAREFALRALADLDRVPRGERTLVPLETDGGPTTDCIRERMRILIRLGRWGDALRFADSTRTGDGVNVAFAGIAAARGGNAPRAQAVLSALESMPDSAFWDVPTHVAAEAGVLAALGERAEALRHLADAQARHRLPRSYPHISVNASVAGSLLQFLWHDPELERMFPRRN